VLLVLLGMELLRNRLLLHLLPHELLLHRRPHPAAVAAIRLRREHHVLRQQRAPPRPGSISRPAPRHLSGNTWRVCWRWSATQRNATHRNATQRVQSCARCFWRRARASAVPDSKIEGSQLIGLVELGDSGTPVPRPLVRLLALVAIACNTQQQTHRTMRNVDPSDTSVQMCSTHVQVAPGIGPLLTIQAATQRSDLRDSFPRFEYIIFGRERLLRRGVSFMYFSQHPLTGTGLECCCCCCCCCCGSGYQFPAPPPAAAISAATCMGSCCPPGVTKYPAPAGVKRP